MGVNTKLDELINQLLTERGKTKALLKAVFAGIVTDEQRIRGLARRYPIDHGYQAYGRLAEKGLGLSAVIFVEEQAKLFEESNPQRAYQRYISALEVAHKAGLEEQKEHLFQETKAFLEARIAVSSAASIRNKDYERLIRLHEKYGQLNTAIDLSIDYANSLLAVVEEPEHIEFIYNADRQRALGCVKEQAVNYFITTLQIALEKNPGRAQQLYQQLMSRFESKEDYDICIKLAETMGDTEKKQAIQKAKLDEMIDQCDHYGLAMHYSYRDPALALFHLRRGRFSVDLGRGGGEHNPIVNLTEAIAENAQKQGRLTTAISAWAFAENFYMAFKITKQLGDLKKAREFAECGGMFDECITLSDQLGEPGMVEVYSGLKTILSPD